MSRSRHDGELVSRTWESLRQLLVVVAALALIGHGGVELAPRLASAGATVASAAAGTPTAGRPAASRPAAESQPAERGSTLRILTTSAVVPSGSADPAAGPGAAPLLAQHLSGRPVARPPTFGATGGPDGAASGRAPPGPAGT